MTELLAISFDSEASPLFRIRTAPREETLLVHPCGWGLAWYPHGDSAVAVVRDPAAEGDNPLTRALGEWKRFRSTVFVCHVHGAARRRTQQDTHPFDRKHGGRSWVMAHNGDLHGDLAAALPLGDPAGHEPIGRTDSEHVFCWLLNLARREGARTLADLGWEKLHGWLRKANELGTLNLVLTDGHDVAVYQDRERFHGLHWIRRTPPYATWCLGADAFGLDLYDPLDANRTMWIACTRPLTDEPWRAMAGGQMLVARYGAAIWSSHTEAEAGAAPPEPSSRPAAAAATSREPQGATPRGRLFSVVHETLYRYAGPVEVSTHLLRLRPVQDNRQDLIDFRIDLAPAGPVSEYEDVFGNRVTRLEIEDPYRELRITSRSVVRRRPLASLLENAPIGRITIPLVWMPWQREMMHPYLLPPELPESELRELSDFAMSFADRQDYDLLETLLDMNETIHRDFAYLTGSTHLETTPFDVYVDRRGVCQDFANLFICLARLLNVAARYRVGYILTPRDSERRVQSEASHAWAELFLPWVGWRGFDPTNGCLAGLDHVRVAAGRNYRDATPTSGTIFRGGRGETLIVAVRLDVPEESGPRVDGA